ncbi:MULTISPECIES: SMC-Scp complex subunit ScpB [Aneurinibacillus]|uniref:Segregation and condensation protein B n=1 Tax=Aneurinibacillus thermoaerophilus TaxID=143495 RepID=A0ABX8YGQ2_ANETH|nr:MULTISPECIES: SMC-Scp complex subunit ScpB [Aneurinibacillus]AMA74748.1 segregation and condensation protein B [Aneurinibacillus sp. XH2]MED0675043.1 SMC-Scp complex subunit ScpB [Aneurinibacillus thermoaerophilus]MED0679555.1 SMC-Scp complex subunit ScpB [Aneurinibacillus thermoaerophilus]MED0737445.1 SMC-Scp complex subunit ScpB [Aneurinibacillus thermoaerophilus]MED0756295.1 SMC-Scp complex subunit ScpB [Aneurinibacillus thermoaerophilus]
MDIERLKAIVEGLLFVAGDEGIEAKQLASILDLEIHEVVALMDEMKKDYKEQNRGLQIVEIAQAYQFTTRPEFAEYFEKLAHTPSHATLSQAALETLAIIAYKQPITRLELEEIRGVKCESAINRLTSKNLIKEVGRADTIGRPILYGTTKEFLEYFGLRSLDELPPPPEFPAEGSEVEEEEAYLFYQKNKAEPTP